MHFDRTNPTGDVDKDQETTVSAKEGTTDRNLSDEDDHLPLIKRKRTKVHISSKRHKLLRERRLKRPLPLRIADPIPKFDEQPEESPRKNLIFVAESESDSDTDRNREALAIAGLADIAETNQELIQNIPEEYKNLMIFMGGSRSASPNLVLQKRLRKGDVEERRNRLLIPQRKIKTNFLEVEEEEKLNRDIWWMVEIIEPDCSVSLITLSKWETWKGVAYVFITEWNGLVERNELKEGDLMQLWSFRAAGGGGGRRGRLCFMLLELDDNREENDKVTPSQS
ncbi:B3 domain-containing protein At1g05920-like [Benincasa hispida]|uniref:B3 domain-containing protein At1g05920-like n=1 Tax=Benincasa hispida TaxID=102211 RepID=UPI0018FFE040|nr:B3 domain-containing protein At1g05920-like [Benincasa hispida]